MTTITIHTNRDLTPRGKRRAQVVTHDRGIKRLWWYVSGRRYRCLLVTAENVALTRKWLLAEYAPH